MTITDIQAKVSKVAADVPFTGASLDISAKTDFKHIVIRVNSLTAGKKARIQITDSLDAFANKVVRWSPKFVGAIDASAPVVVSIPKRELWDLRINTVNAVLRAELVELTADGAIDYQVWLEE